MDVIVIGKRCIMHKGKRYLQGEVIYGMSDKDAGRLIDIGHAKSTADNDGPAAESIPIEEMKVDELKDFLDRRQVEYPSDARKDDLLELAKAHETEPTAE